MVAHLLALTLMTAGSGPARGVFVPGKTHAPPSEATLQACVEALTAQAAHGDAVCARESDEGLARLGTRVRPEYRADVKDQLRELCAQRLERERRDPHARRRACEQGALRPPLPSPREASRRYPAFAPMRARPDAGRPLR